MNARRLGVITGVGGGIIAALGLLTVGGAGCGGSSAGPVTTVGPGGDSGGTGPLTQPSISVQGGSAPSVGGQGTAGGTVHMIATGALSLDPALPAPAASAVPAAPAGATAVATSALTADVNASGSVVIDGSVTSGATDPVRQITAGGDIFVSGSLRSADLGAARQGLTLNAPGGTVYVSGTIDTSGEGAGQAGGPLTIVAGRVIVVGKLTSSGGDAQATAPSTGGHGGDLKLQATGDIAVGGTATVRGGAGNSLAADATGGDAGGVTIDCGGTLTFSGILDGRGGLATASSAGGQVVGGAASALKVGESTAPQSIAVLVPLLLTGGDGAAIGGNGGTAMLEPHGGDLRLAGTLDASGGSSAAKPGAGGAINGNPGPDLPSAGVDVGGQVLANGGAISTGGSGDGADGGVIKLVVLSTAGDMTIEANGQVQTDGGKSEGQGRGGGGGLLYLFTNDGNADITGKLFARGGDADDQTGTGGLSGMVYVFTDNNHGGTEGGALVIEPTGYIESTGGSGAVGGDGRNDGRANAVAIFPINQDDEYGVDQIAVLINSDGKHGPATGYIDNRGRIVTHGGKTNGAGGDVVFHGRNQDGNETPSSGTLEMSGDGTGAGGDFAGE